MANLVNCFIRCQACPTPSCCMVLLTPAIEHKQALPTILEPGVETVPLAGDIAKSQAVVSSCKGSGEKTVPVPCVTRDVLSAEQSTSFLAALREMKPWNPAAKEASMKMIKAAIASGNHRNPARWKPL